MADYIHKMLWDDALRCVKKNIKYIQLRQNIFVTKHYKHTYRADTSRRQDNAMRRSEQTRWNKCHYFLVCSQSGKTNFYFQQISRFSEMTISKYHIGTFIEKLSQLTLTLKLNIRICNTCVSVVYRKMHSLQLTYRCWLRCDDTHK